jgi:hypothetical protein
MYHDRTYVFYRAIFVDSMVIARRAMPLGIARIFLRRFFSKKAVNL